MSIVKLEGWGARMNFSGTDLNLALFRQIMVENRIFTKNTVFINHATKDLLDEVHDISKFAIDRIREGLVKLKGPMPKKPVAQIIREKR